MDVVVLVVLILFKFFFFSCFSISRPIAEIDETHSNCNAKVKSWKVSGIPFKYRSADD